MFSPSNLFISVAVSSVRMKKKLLVTQIFMLSPASRAEGQLAKVRTSKKKK